MMKNIATMLIAVTICFLPLYIGYEYGRSTAPKPCIKTLSIYSYPTGVFRIFQDALDNNIEDSELYRNAMETSSVLTNNTKAMDKDSDHPSVIYTNEKNGMEFIVPGLCYVGAVDFMGDPTLYRKDY